MTEYKASRTLVKSPPELWSEVSEASSLKRHLDQFGEIRITKLEPESTVAWEGESARGTVKLEPSGWGTKVILTAVPGQDETLGQDEALGQDETLGQDEALVAGWMPHGPIEPEIRELRAVVELRGPNQPRRRRSRGRAFVQAVLRWLGVEQGEREGAPAPRLTSTPEAAPVAEAADPLGSAAAPALALNSALDSLGRAHHRPYSRA